VDHVLGYVRRHRKLSHERGLHRRRIEKMQPRIWLDEWNHPLRDPTINRARAHGEQHSELAFPDKLRGRRGLVHPSCVTSIPTPAFALAVRGYIQAKGEGMNSERFSQPARGNPRLQRLVLRVAALVSFIAAPAIVLPRIAVEKLSWLMGFGQPPMLPMLVYLTAGGSCVLIAEAFMLWLISGDVVRYRPLVVFVAWFFLAAAPLFLWIDSQAGLPLWWTAMDTLSCLVAGAALVWACYSTPRHRR
jgi:hypothetical protein